MSPYRTQHGLTLLELLIALLITAIVAAIATPSFSGLMGERRVAASARAYAATLRIAQAAALARNRTIEVLFTAAEPTPLSVVGAAAAPASEGRWLARVRSATEPTDFIDGHSLPVGSAAVQVVADVNVIGFTALGRPVTFAGGLPSPLDDTVVVRFSDAASSRRMCTYLTTGGAVRICNPGRSSGQTGACVPQLAAGAC